MFLRCKVRRKDGKQHLYWSVVENTRVAGGRMVQRHVLSGRDQRFAGIGLAAVDRGFGGWRRAAADTVAVSGRPCRGAADGCFGRRRQTVGVASGSGTAVGRVLAGTDAVARWSSISSGRSGWE